MYFAQYISDQYLNQFEHKPDTAKANYLRVYINIAHF